jgi:hypothetical protein
MTETFGMYCENRYLMEITESMMFVGPVMGNLVLSVVADNKGRRLAQNLGWIILTFGVIGTTFFTNPYGLIVFTFISG